MSSLLRYRGYEGSVEYSAEDGLYYGMVLGIKSLISYEGGNVQELERNFRGAVNDCLQICVSDGVIPE